MNRCHHLSWSRRSLTFALVCALGFAGLGFPASAQNPVQGVVLEQHLEGGQGVTVLHVWGSHHEMGYAHGVLLADWIQLAYTQMKTTFSVYWPALRTRVAGWTFLPLATNDEFQGILDGLKAVHPESTADLLDLKVCSTFGDWSYSACRSTSCWGDWVEPPYTTLSARKLQFLTLPAQITQQWHHVICAWEPDDGSPQWVNFGFPGWASSVTGLNEYGTLASLHDWNSSSGTNWPDALPRTMACRWTLTMNLGADPSTHLQTVFDALHLYHAATGGFLNYYVPDGGAGVIKTSKNQGFYAIRRPRPEYMNGQSISTNNSDIDGTSGIEPWQAYYQTLDPAAGIRATMDGLWATAAEATDMHIVEIGFRAPRDMAIWFTGRMQTTSTQKIEWEWVDLFRNPAAVESVESSGRLPASFPNPAVMTEVTITLNLPGSASSTNARLGIFDASGRLIRSLSPAEFHSEAQLTSRGGGHEAVFRWDGLDERGATAASGAYLCRLLGRRQATRVIWIGRKP